MILIVGDKPSKRTDPNVPFKNAACEARLKSWIKELGIKDYKLINRISPYFELALVLASQSNVPIIALGNNASKAIGDKYEHFKLPHPSGRNRLLNSRSFTSNILKACRRWIGQ